MDDDNVYYKIHLINGSEVSFWGKQSVVLGSDDFIHFRKNTGRELEFNKQHILYIERMQKD